MSSLAKQISFIITFFFVIATPSFGQVAEHFYNDPTNLHADPNYTPGDFSLSDQNDARTYYQVKKEELVMEEDALKLGELFSTGLGEIRFTTIKNESAQVLGYFRHYFAVASLSEVGIQSLKILIDVNSLDTAVPGRNNRILEIFFESMKPELGTVIIELTEFDMTQAQWNQLQSGEEVSLQTSGNIFLNNVSKNIAIPLSFKKQNQTWLIKTQEPFELLISDFDFGDRIYELMKECNHESMGNKVKVESKIYLR